MIKIIKRLLGIDLLEEQIKHLNTLLERDLKELSSTDLVYLKRIKDLEKDIRDLCIFLKIERFEEWEEDTKFNPPHPKLKVSKWTKKKKK